MKKDTILAPLLPFTDEEEAALSTKLDAMNPAALQHYVESAQIALRNTALDPSWRPRVEIGLMKAEAALLKAPPAAAAVVEAPEPPVAAKKARKTAAAA